jgi:homoserine O-acetyltransferase
LEAQIYRHNETFILESGQQLPHLDIAYHTYGQLNASGDNAVWVCHALTANSDVSSWWTGLVGSGKPLDPEKHFIVCANIIGSCYGSSGPLSINSDTGKPYYRSFPEVTIRDMVQAHQVLRDHLGISKIALLVGGSMGGYQALEWAWSEPKRIDKLFLLCTGASESAWGIAIHTAQRMAIQTDPTWEQEDPKAGYEGLRTARAIGMITYRNYQTFVRTQTDPDNHKTDGFRASSYMEYQGTKLANRFHAQSYYLLTKAMDSHNLSRGRFSDVQEALKQIVQPTLIIGIESDILCPPEEQVRLAESIPLSEYHEIDSSYGHDGFLIEFDKIGPILNSFL